MAECILPDEIRMEEYANRIESQIDILHLDMIAVKQKMRMMLTVVASQLTH